MYNFWQTVAVNNVTCARGFPGVHEVEEGLGSRRRRRRLELRLLVFLHHVTERGFKKHSAPIVKQAFTHSVDK